MPRGVRDHAVGGHDGETFDAIGAGHVRGSSLYAAPANAKGRPCGRPSSLQFDDCYSTSRTTLETGRWLTVGSLASFISSSSYCGSDVTAVRGFMCTIL